MTGTEVRRESAECLPNLLSPCYLPRDIRAHMPEKPPTPCAQVSGTHKEPAMHPHSIFQVSRAAAPGTMGPVTVPMGSCRSQFARLARRVRCPLSFHVVLLGGRGPRCTTACCVQPCSPHLRVGTQAEECTGPRVQLGPALPHQMLMLRSLARPRVHTHAQILCTGHLIFTYAPPSATD